jgi:hypothetical protein
MSKLICVECGPEPVNGSRKVRDTPLTGFVGETLEKYLHEKHNEKKIPVRFPLTGPGSHVSLIRSDRDPLDPYTLALEGEYVSKSNLYVLKGRTPVSLYKRIPICKTEDIFEKPVYFSVYGLSTFIEMINQLKRSYSWSWLWKLEKNAIATTSHDKFKHVFLEARFYGIDSVITTYDGNKFRGVAVEIIYRPQPSAKMLEKGIRVLRTCSDLYLFSNTEEYISYIDGVNVPRERASGPHLAKNRYSSFITPKQAVSLGRFKDHYAKVVEEKKRVPVAKEKKVKGDVPPPTSSKKERHSFTAEVAKLATQAENPNYHGAGSYTIHKTNGGS